MDRNRKKNASLELQDNNKEQKHKDTNVNNRS